MSTLTFSAPGRKGEVNLLTLREQGLKRVCFKLTGETGIISPEAAAKRGLNVCAKGPEITNHNSFTVYEGILAL